MKMRRYNIINPANEAELGEELRSKTLNNQVITLVVKEILDELAARRQGSAAVQKELDFRVEELYLSRPTRIMGSVACLGDAIARIESIGSDDDDTKNSLELTVLF